MAISGLSSGSLGTLSVTFAADAQDLINAFGAATKATADGSASITNSVLKLGAVVAASLTGIATAAVNEFAKFESSFANVRKTIQANEAEYGRLADSFRNLAKEIPVNVNEINNVAAAAGQLGIKKDNILQFTKTMLDLGQTTNLTAEHAASALARFANITQMPQTQFDKLGSTVMALDYSLATTASEVVDMAMRIAGAGTNIGMSEPQILGFAAALSSVGIQAELGGTAMNQLMIRINEAVNQGGGRLREFAAVAGMSGDQFTKVFAQNGAQAVIKFIQGLQAMHKNGEDTFYTLEQLGINGIRLTDVLTRAANAGGLFNEALTTSQKAWNANDALARATAERYATFNSQMTITMNLVRDTAITLGAKLAPEFLQLAGVVRFLLTQSSDLGDWFMYFAKLVVPIVLTAVGMIGDAWNGVRLIWSMIKVANAVLDEALVAGLQMAVKAIKAGIDGLFSGITSAVNHAIDTVNMFKSAANQLAHVEPIRVIDDLSGDLDKAAIKAAQFTKDEVANFRTIAKEANFSDKLLDGYNTMVGGIAKANKKLVADVVDTAVQIGKQVQTVADIERNRAMETLDKMQAPGVKEHTDKSGNKSYSYKKGLLGIPGMDDPQMTKALELNQMLKDAKTEQDKLQEINDKKIQLSEAYNSKKFALEKAWADKSRALQEARAQIALQSASSTFDSLAQIAETWGGKTSAFYQAMFIMSKAFAIADATVKIAQGIANAASLPYPANLAAMASVAAATASVVQSISAVTLNLQGKLKGGPVSAGTPYIVGEGGPEIFMPSDNGNIIPNDKIGGMVGGGNTRVIVNNYTDAHPEVRERTEGNEKILEIIVKKAKQDIAAEIRDGRGHVSKAMEHSYNLARGRSTVR